MSSEREKVGVIILTLAFIFATHYYDPSFNYLFLFIFFCLAGFGYLVLGSSKQTGLSTKEIFACTALCLLVCHQWVFTRSPDSSFATVIVVAMIPVFVLIARESAAMTLYWCLFGVVAVMSAYSVVEFLTYGVRSGYPLVDPNNYVTLLCLAWIPSLFILAKGDTRPASLALTIGGTFVFALAILATHSRFAWVALLGTLVFLLLGTTAGGVNKRMWIVSALAALGASGVYLYGSEGSVVQDVSSLITKPIQGQEEDAGIRLAMIYAAWQMVVEHGNVIFGHGLNTFALLYPAYRSVEDQVTAGMYAHNDYVQILFEGGLLILVPILGVGIAIVVKLAKTVFLRKAWDNSIGFAFACGVAMLHANLNFVFYILVLSIFLGLNLSLAFPSTRRWQNFSMPMPLVILGFFITSLYLLLDVYNVGVYSAQKGIPGTASIRKDIGIMERFTDWSIRLNDDRGLPKLGRAEVHRILRPNEIDHLSKSYEEAIETDPWNPLGFSRYSALVADDPEKYGDLLMQAAKLNPQDPATKRSLIHHFWLSGNVDLAEENAREILQWCQLIQKRSSVELDALISYLKDLNSRMQSTSLAEELELCDQVRVSTNSGLKHDSTWLQRWLTGE